MANIIPFKGLRYNKEKVKKISSVIAPPYDVISPEQRKELKKSSPYNIVNLTLPDEGPSTNKYENANKMLLEWLSENILVFDKQDCFYLFEESFIENGHLKTFTGFIGLLKVEEYGKGRVLRHEKTLLKPKEDRLNLLNACRTNFEFIYTIYNDSNNYISEILESEKEKNALISTDSAYDENLKFNLWKISETEKIQSILEAIKTKTLLIADGHHRYETSRLYRENLNKSKKNLHKTADQKNKLISIFSPEDYVLALFVSSGQKDISIHPTHRVVKFNKVLTPEEFKEKVENYFEIEPIHASEKIISQKMSEAKLAGKKSLCICFKNGICYFAVLDKDLESIYEEFGNSTETFIRDFEYLDVNILHKLVFSFLLKEYKAEDIKFIHTINEVFENINNTDEDMNTYDAGFILNAPDINTVEELSAKDMIMPQKSTYFYPKPCSGLVLYKFSLNNLKD